MLLVINMTIDRLIVLCGQVYHIDSRIDRFLSVISYGWLFFRG